MNGEDRNSDDHAGSASPSVTGAHQDLSEWSAESVVGDSSGQMTPAGRQGVGREAE